MRFSSVVPADIIFGSYTNRSIKVEPPIKFQIPRMYMPFGISGFAPPYGQVKYNIDFSMKGFNEPDNYVKKFYEFLMEIESKVLNHIESLSMEIFNQTMSKTDLTTLFNSNIKVSTGYDPKFRVKVSDKTQFFDISDKELHNPLEEGLYKKFSGAAFIQLGNIYFFNKKFGITWSIEQMKVYEPQRIHGFNFAEPEYDDDDDGDATTPVKMSGCQFL